MTKKQIYTIRVVLIVALGGFLMGFDASVISGVVKFIEPQFNLSKLELGWSVSSLTLTSTLAMMFAGPLSDRYGRKPMLQVSGYFICNFCYCFGFCAKLSVFGNRSNVGWFWSGSFSYTCTNVHCRNSTSRDAR